MRDVKGDYGYCDKEQALIRKIQATLRERFELYDFDEKALRPGLALPIKRYAVGKVLRDGPDKRGRLREFLQCDVDVVGVEGPEVEIELMQLALDVFRSLGINGRLKWNNRRFLRELLEAAAVPVSEIGMVLLALEGLTRTGTSGVKKQLQMSGLTDTAVSAVMALLANNESGLEQLLEAYNLEGSAGAKEVLAVRHILRTIGLEKECWFDPFLSRDPSVYTGTVYEAFNASDSFATSLGGGGRYGDAITWQLIGRDEAVYDSARLSFEVEAIVAHLEYRSVEPGLAPAVLIPIGVTAGELLQTAAELRGSGVRVRLDRSGRELEIILASLAGDGVRYAVLLGERSGQAGLVRLLDLEEQTEKEVCVDEAIYIIGDCYGSRYEPLFSC